jgi:hypothetical protein
MRYNFPRVLNSWKVFRIRDMKELIEKLVDIPSPYNSKLCKVVKVNKDARTCDVEPLDGTATIFDVRLQAFQDDTEGVVLYPKMSSMVVVTLLNNETGYVSLTSEVDYVQFKNGGVDLRTELDKMFDLMGSLIDLLTKFQLMTNMGVTVQVMPNVVLELEKLKQKNDKIKKQFNKIIQ